MADHLFGVQHDFKTTADGHADRGSDDREGGCLHALHGVLEVGEKVIQAIHVFASEKFTHCLQIYPAGKMLRIVMYDQAAH